MAFLVKYFKRHWLPFTTALFILALEAACDLLMPTVMARLIDRGVIQQDLDYMLRMGGILIVLTLGGALAATVRNIISSNVSQKMGSEIRYDLYAKIQSMDFAQINALDSGSLITRLTNDVNLIQQFIHGIMRVFVKAPMIFLGSLLMVISLSPRLAIVLAVILPLVAISMTMNMRMGYPYFMKMQNAIDRLNGSFREYLAGVRVVKAFNRFDHEDNRFDIHNDSLKQTGTQAMRVMAVFSPLNTLILNLGIAILILFGGHLVNLGTLEVGRVMALVNYMMQIIMSLGLITMIFNLLVRTKASAVRIDEIFSIAQGMEGKPDEEAGTYEMKSLFSNGMLTFDQVGFKYDASSTEWVLKGLNFQCKLGDTIGIIGATGSGKSALVQLIPRLYDVSEGDILLNGRSLKTFSPHDLRQYMAVVPQKSFLFSGTIRDNLLWGDRLASESTIANALEIAQAKGFTESFPEGLSTLLGQGGVNLSGGQKQRLSIARALVRQPKLLILDDCTSAVDLTTEQRIRAGLKTLSSDLTCFIVAQRIATVKTADQILVLDQGRQVGFGTHEQLMNSCDIYKDIYYSQYGKEEAVS